MTKFNGRVPRILLTNDDGIEAPGMELLEEIAHEFGDEIWVIAPEHDQSGAGQRITLTTPLRKWPYGERRWAVSGTPSDCVGMALSHFMKDTPPSLIISGINAGANVGDEVSLSGTLGAAFTGIMLGVPSLAINQAFGESRNNINWDTSRAIAPKMLRHFLKHGWPEKTCLSINIPDCPTDKIAGFSWARQSAGNIMALQANENVDQREGLYYWMQIMREDPAGTGNTDCAILARNEVAVTVLTLDRSVDMGQTPVKFDADE